MENIITGRTANLGITFATLAKREIGFVPKTAIILGSGLADAVQNSNVFGTVSEFGMQDFSLCHLPDFSADGHKLRILLVEEKYTKEKAIVICGRKHIYEVDKDGDLKEVVRIPRALALAGITNFIHTSAVGGIDPHEPGSLILVSDHAGADLIPRGLFTGTDGDKFGPLFFDCSKLYEKSIKERLVNKYSKKGVLQWHMGPNFETPAQIEILRKNGIAGVGMSMLPEVMALQQIKLNPSLNCRGIKNIGIGVVANPAAGIGEAIDDADVKSVMGENAPKIMEFISQIMREL